MADLPRTLGFWGLRIGILVVTMSLAFAGIVFGRDTETLTLTVAEPAPQDFIATEDKVVIDDAETQRLRNEAAGGVAEVYREDPTITQNVLIAIDALFDTVAALVVDQAAIDAAAQSAATTLPTTVPTTVPAEPEPTTSTTSTTLAEGEEPPPTTTTTLAPTEVGTVTGTLFLDGDMDGVFSSELEGSGDAPLAGVRVLVRPAEGDVIRSETDVNGVFLANNVPAGELTVSVDASDPSFPENFTVSTPELEAPLEVVDGEELEVPALGFRPLIRSVEEVVANILEAYPDLQVDTATKLTDLALGDVMREAIEAGSAHLGIVEDSALERAEQMLSEDEGIRVEDVQEARVDVNSSPPVVRLDGRLDNTAMAAAANVVSTQLLPNSFLDDDETEALREQARNGIADVEVTFAAGTTIVREGDPISATELQAIDELGLLETEDSQQPLALFAVIAVLLFLLSLYLLRFRPSFWEKKRRVMLFGMLFVLAAWSARLVFLAIPESNPAIGYLLPAGAIGLMAAILFDGRIAAILAVAIGTLTALATQDLGYTLFGLLGTFVAIPFVSSISSRGELRRAVVLSAVALAALAAPIAWLFHGSADTLTVVRDAAILAFLNGLIFGLIGVTALSFLEITFDVTTTLRLLDLIDRNHPALRLLEQEARGTFNHSLMVGTLADQGGRSIGANNLLAQAGGYYHDLGKTENPIFFIENQIGISNPHDQLPPEESAEIIRQHVSDGQELADRYNIPEDVAEAIMEHHGDSVMRYFYAKAVDRYGEENVDVDDYRHLGRKPRSKEMSIVMMADGVEGACRAIFAQEDPSPERIAEVVDQVVREKLDDGQLGDSQLTMGELTRVKAAFTDALIGNYHQRIPYPDFPGNGDVPREQGRPASHDLDATDVK